ncbi:MAG TPA: EF-hand domain-containing protein [Kofleriaceae bacterium]|nr:EF-hand domain-containing protein [Kofleriaceae bacterium]
MKRIALLLLVAGACKTTDSQPQPQPSDPTPTVRSAARPAPALPAAPAAMAEGSDRPQLPPGDRAWGHKGDRMARMDKDGDGKISDEERAAAMKERSEKLRARLDANGDGKLTPDELANGKGRMKFDDPAALDTNHDGDISADELQAGMEARRDEMRAQRMKDRLTGSGATD